jgi:hypothetical protein
MTAPIHPHGRVGAQHRAKLKKWSDKVAREDDARVVVASVKLSVARRRRTLDAARKKLRKLFH